MKTYLSTLCSMQEHLIRIPGYVKKSTLLFFLIFLFQGFIQAQASAMDEGIQHQNPYPDYQIFKKDSLKSTTRWDDYDEYFDKYFNEFKDSVKHHPLIHKVPQVILDESADFLEVLKAMDDDLILVWGQGNNSDTWKGYDGVYNRSKEFNINCLFDYRWSSSLNRHVNEIPLDLIDEIYFGKGLYLYKDFRDIPRNGHIGYMNLFIFTKDRIGADLVNNYLRLE